MTPATFKAKWAKFTGKESAAYQEHFNDLCRMLGVPTPVEEDPTGKNSFCFQKHVAKDAELFQFDAEGNALPSCQEKGFADVWKSDCFGWEYKGPNEDLEKAHKQLLRYRESLLNPPLLIVCDFNRYIVRTNFNGAVQETHSFTNAQIDSPDAIRVLRAALTNPDELRPKHTTAEVTEKLARQIADIAMSLQKREAVELASAKTRKAHHVGQRKNLRIARFLNRLVFCFFAEDTELLPKGLFSEVCKLGLKDPQHFAESLEDLFKTMAKGGRYGTDKIRHFNGHLFEDATVFDLTAEEIGALATAAAADWQNIRPAIMGTLFERALDEGQRSQLGAHYTSEEDSTTLVEPVLMAPYRREWTALRRDLAKTIMKGKGSVADRAKLAAFQTKLASVIVLDPACGSGNFLYIALQLLLGLEKEVIAIAAQLGWTFTPQVTVQQLRAIELNAYAYELAQVSVQIGYLQWRRDNGFDNDRSPVLQNLEGFENKDALLHETFRTKPKDLKAAQAEEHGRQDELFRAYTERAWPACDVIVGNPPFLGDKFMRRELGDAYVEDLRKIYGKRIPGQSDLCCYWFEKARQQIEDGECERAGLLATQGIRGGANREVLKRIKDTGEIFFAVSERPWILQGANVSISMIGFDDGTENEILLDGSRVLKISAQLSATETTHAGKLKANANLSFIGASMHGPFPIDSNLALEFILSPNPSGRLSSDVVRPWCNGLSIVQRQPEMWLVDFPPDLSEEEAALYEMPFEYLRKHVWPVRAKNRRAMRRKNWWILGDPQKAMRAAISLHKRFLATPRVAKHRVFVWMASPILATDQVIAFEREDDCFQGIAQSKFHESWALKQCTVLGGNTPRYGPSTCFETFPLPRPTTEQGEAIAAAAKELNELRERWLNPPEWTETRLLEFPASVDGPWSRFVHEADATGIGTARYPRLEPRDAECAAKLAKRTLTNLYNERPAWLDNAHKKLDAAVAAAYGWQDLTEILQHAAQGEIYDFKAKSYAMLDATPAGFADAIKELEQAVDDEILARLLALNLKRAAEEAKATKTPAKQRGKKEDEIL